MSWRVLNAWLVDEAVILSDDLITTGSVLHECGAGDGGAALRADNCRKPREQNGEVFKRVTV